MQFNNWPIWAWTLAVVVALSTNVAIGQVQPQLEIIPANPRYQEPVFARIRSAPSDFGRPYAVMVTSSGDAINVTWQVQPEIGPYTMDVELGRFPAGTYKVNISHGNAASSAEFTVGSAPIQQDPSRPPAVPTANYSDVWWTPSESGTGLMIAQGPTNVLFAFWCVYDANGTPTWYTIQPGEWQTPTFFVGPIYRTTGPYFGGAYDPSKVQLTLVGTAALAFSDYRSATFSFGIDGIRGVKNLTRFAIE